MTKLERTLLENILDSLDRLFDRENQVVDIHDLLMATSAALAATEHSSPLEAAMEKTSTVLRSKMSSKLKRDAALGETQSLREYLSDILYRDSPLTI